MPRGSECIFLGYPEGQKAYKLYDLVKREFLISRDVEFWHDEIALKVLPPIKSATKTMSKKYTTYGGNYNSLIPPTYAAIQPAAPRITSQGQPSISEAEPAPTSTEDKPNQMTSPSIIQIMTPHGPVFIEAPPVPIHTGNAPEVPIMNSVPMMHPPHYVYQPFPMAMVPSQYPPMITQMGTLQIPKPDPATPVKSNQQLEETLSLQKSHQ
jgi:hypothetical protein